MPRIRARNGARPPDRVRRPAPPSLRYLTAVLAAGGACAAQAMVQVAVTRDLGDLSIEELSQIQVMSVSKRAEPLSQSPAAIYVISGEDIRRSGATSLPEALRLAPNLDVARVNASTYVISARGFNSVNSSNKLLVLIDGRSIFTPLFNSVLWDQQDVPLGDVERIEVISGPGGTLWGANAVNGVINVITRAAGESQGGLLDAKAGNFTQRADARWGGKLGESGSYRAYVTAFRYDDTRLAAGANARDAWHGKQAGFRSDFTAYDSAFTVQGDVYDNQVDDTDGTRNGGNLLGRWSKALAGGGNVEVQAYYEHVARAERPGEGLYLSQRSQTFDLQLQHSFAFADRHQVVWGLGQRTWRDLFVNAINPFVLDPERQTVNLSNAFVQDTVALAPDVKLVLGTKLEHSSFSGWALMPNVRLGWQATPRDFLWAAVSRAVRPPSRLERDLTFPGLLPTSPQFRSEKVVAYEAGWRSQLAAQATASVSLFYNHYTDLRTTTPTATQTFGNALEGNSYGVEAWASFHPVHWWRIDPGVSVLGKNFHVKPGQVDIAGPQTVLGHDPAQQYFVRSYFDLARDVQLFASLRKIAALPGIDVPHYVEADLRLAWQATRDLELAITGANLLHPRHAEASEPPVHEIPRSVYAGVRWTF